MSISKSELEEYHRCGYLVARNVIPLDAIAGLQAGVQRLYEKYNPANGSGDGSASDWDAWPFQQGMMDFRRAAPSDFGAVYDTMQTHVKLQQLTYSPGLVEAAAALLGDQSSGLTSTGQILRMDSPGDTRHRLEWHQESSYTEVNANGAHCLTVWIPMQQMEEDLGPIVVCPGSHKLGKIATERNADRDRSMSETKRLPDELVSQFEQISVIPNQGDALLFHMDLFHRSGYNTSNRMRFTACTRFHRAVVEDFVPGNYVYQPNARIAARVFAGSGQTG